MAMQLSEAIILGDTLKRCDPMVFISPDGSCGCAFGGALLATGVTPQEYHSQTFLLFISDMPLVKARWPWLTEKYLVKISVLYHKVADGRETIEDVAAYVRTIEPAANEGDEVEFTIVQGQKGPQADSVTKTGAAQTVR